MVSWVTLKKIANEHNDSQPDLSSDFLHGCETDFDDFFEWDIEAILITAERHFMYAKGRC